MFARVCTQVLVLGSAHLSQSETCWDDRAVTWDATYPRKRKHKKLTRIHPTKIVYGGITPTLPLGCALRFFADKMPLNMYLAHAAPATGWKTKPTYQFHQALRHHMIPGLKSLKESDAWLNSTVLTKSGIPCRLRDPYLLECEKEHDRSFVPYRVLSL